MLLYFVCQRYKVHPAEVFKLAFEYAEIAISPNECQKYFKHCLKHFKGHDYYVAIEPEFVQDYCLDLLIGKTKLPRYYHKGNIVRF